MKAKEKKRIEAQAKMRARMNRLSGEINQIDAKLDKGITVARGPKREFVSLRKLREAALDNLTVLAHATYTGHGAGAQ